MKVSNDGITVAEVAAYIGAQLSDELVSGAPSEDVLLAGVSSIGSAKKDQLSFIISDKYLAEVQECSAGAIIASAELADQLSGKLILVHPQPYLAYAKATELFAEIPQGQGVSEQAIVSPSAKVSDSAYLAPFVVVEEGAVIEENCHIGAGCYIGSGVTIGKNTRLNPNVTLYAGITIGADCLFHSGVVIGSDGFGFSPSSDGWVKIHQFGSVVVGDKVEIGANVNIARGALEDTLIGNGVKIDSLVMIGHNVEVGDRTLLVAQVGVAGSTKLGSDCTIAGQVGIAGHINITDGVRVTGGSMVTRSLSEPGQYSSGIPVEPSKQWRRNTVRLRQIEKLVERVSELEQAIKSKAKK